MAEVKGIAKLVWGLKQQKKTPPQVNVLVGYTAKYAVYVHEDLDAWHDVGQAKFLEKPARALRRRLRQIIANAVASKCPLETALELAGLYLQRESQKLVPVDTGNLYQSAFTLVEKA